MHCHLRSSEILGEGLSGPKNNALETVGCCLPRNLPLCLPCNTPERYVRRFKQVQEQFLATKDDDSEILSHDQEEVFDYSEVLEVEVYTSPIPQLGDEYRKFVEFYTPKIDTSRLSELANLDYQNLTQQSDLFDKAIVAAADFIGVGDVVRYLARDTLDSYKSKALKLLEGLILLLGGLATSTSVANATFIVGQWLSARLEGNLLEEAMKFVEPLLSQKANGEVLEEQASFDTSAVPAIIESLKIWKTTPGLSGGTALFGPVKKLLSLLVSVGLCEAASCTFSIKGVKLFSPMIDKKLSITSIPEAILDVAITFLETGWRCFSSGSLVPLLYGDAEFIDICEKADHLQEMAKRHANGTIEYVKYGSRKKLDTLEYLYTITDSEALNAMFLEVEEAFKKMAKTTESQAIRMTALSKLSSLRSFYEHFKEVKKRGGLKIAPFSMGFFGDTGCGKTTVCKQLTSILLAVNGFDNSPDRMANINLRSNFLEGVNNMTLAINIDDFCNAVPENSDVNPVATQLEIVGNEKVPAVMASLEEKGKIYPNPMIFTTTRNIKDCHASYYSVCPGSIMRRDNVIITVRARPEVMTDGMIDSTKAQNYRREFPGASWEDVWLLTLEKVVVDPGDELNETTMRTTGKARYEVIKDDGIELRWVPVSTALHYLIKASKRHFAEQEKLVRDAGQMHTRVKLCETCEGAFGLCPCTTCETCERPALACKCKCPCCDDNKGRCHTKQLPDGSRMCKWKYQQEELQDLHIQDTYVELEPDEIEERDRQVPGRTLGKWLIDRASHLVNQPVFKESHFDEEEENLPEVWQAREEGIQGPLMEDGTFGGLDEQSPNFSTGWLEAIFILMGIRFMIVTISRSYNIVPAYPDHIDSFIAWLDHRQQIRQNWFVQAADLLPTAIFENSYIGGMIRFVRRYHLYYLARHLFWSTMIMGYSCLITWMYYWGINPWMFILFNTLYPLACFSAATLIFASMDHALRPRVNLSFRDLYTRYDANIRSAAVVGTTILAAFTALKFYHRLTEQTNLDPSSYEEVERRDAQQAIVEKEAQERNWDGQICTLQYTPSTASQTAVAEQLEGVINKNLFLMESQGKATNCIFISTNLLLVPGHLAKKVSESRRVTLRHGRTGTSFGSALHPEVVYFIPGKDLAILYMPEGGSRPDISKFLPRSEVEGVGMVRMFTATPLGIVTDAMHTKHGKWRSTAGTYQGLTYKTRNKTYVGMCMSTLVSVGRKPAIVGFHLAGSDYAGSSSCLTLQEFEDAKRAIASRPCVLLGMEESEPLHEQSGISLNLGHEMHPKSPFQDLNGFFKFHFNTIGRSTFRSSVVPTSISPIVTEVTGQPNIWGPPDVKAADPWRKGAENYANPVWPVPFKHLAWAAKDYFEQLCVIFTMIPAECLLLFTPLSSDDNVCGIDGVRFIDAIKDWTSTGFPWKKVKALFMTDGDDPKRGRHKVLDPMFWDIVRWMEDLYLSGKEVLPVFDTFIKDEAHRKDKPKARLVQACSLPFLLLTRKYFLPLMRILSLYPLRSECYVGINVHGPEWQEMEDHMTKFGEDQIFAGDYSKYDQRLPVQITKTVFDIWIRICEKFGSYDERDLTIMRGIAHDLTNPTLNMNGDLVTVCGSNPSGQGLTVYLNSAANSLLLRCGFYKTFVERPKYSLGFIDRLIPPPIEEIECKFADHVAIGTYGDDVKGSVSKEASDRFNIATYAAYMAIMGSVFTMPDKSSFMKKLMKNSEADFLKMIGIYHEALGLKIGALSHESILRSLIIRGRTKLSDLEHAVSVINGAAREWFAHGKEEYEFRRAQLIEIASRAKILSLCTELDFSYEQQVDRWKQRYN